MTGLPGRWPIWDIVYAIRRSAMSCSATVCSAGAGAQAHDHLVGVHSHLFFIRPESRRVDIAGITIHPNEPWMKQRARNVTMEGCGILRDRRYLLLDRDTKFTQSFQAIIASGQVEPLVLPARSPNLNAYADRWVRSVKEEILCRCSGRVIPVRCNPTTKALESYPDDGPHSK
jgi:hypothetical protein